LAVSAKTSGAVSVRREELSMAGKKKKAGKGAAQKAPVVKNSAPPAERQAKREAEQELETGCDEMMSEIDGHPLASPDVPKQTSIEFYRHLAIECGNRADGLQEELGSEDDSGEGE
jgi:hypothetical protein